MPGCVCGEREGERLCGLVRVGREIHKKACNKPSYLGAVVAGGLGAGSGYEPKAVVSTLLCFSNNRFLALEAND